MSHRSRELQKYPKKVIWVYEVIGTYFVDQFYNHLYVMAKKAAEIGHAPNITDGYRSNVMRYHHGISSNVAHYKQAVAGLHEYYQKHSGQGTTTIADFEDQVLTQFIPDEFYDSFTSADRNTALREVVVCIATTLCEAVISRDILPKIIDNHSDTSNVIQLQQLVMSALCTRRDDYFVKFAKQTVRSTGGHNTVDIDTFNALKAEFITEKRIRCDTETTARKLQQMLAAAVGKIKSMSAEMEAMVADASAAKKRVDELLAELSAAKAQINTLRDTQPAAPRDIHWNQLSPQYTPQYTQQHAPQYTQQQTPQYTPQAIGWDRGRQREKTPYPRDPNSYPNDYGGARSDASTTEIHDDNTGAHQQPTSYSAGNPEDNALDILGITSEANSDDVSTDTAGIIAELNSETEKNKQDLLGWGLTDELW